MKITVDDLQRQLQDPDCRDKSLIFLGMSGVGKTYWSEQLGQRYNLPVMHFDEAISASRELRKFTEFCEGQNLAEKTASFLGMPWAEDYPEKEMQFLAVEKSVMSANSLVGGVLDLSGSAIYHTKEIETIISTGLALYLEADVELMLRRYLDNPKPIAWQGMFEQRPGEQHNQALCRCYPLLLESRAKLYKKYSDVVLPYETHRSCKRADELIEQICRLLG